MRKKESKSSNFIVQGGILAVAGIISRIIGLLYRIPLQKTIGDSGMGYYSAAFQIYSIMLIISSYSLPVAVSKLMAARLARGQYKNAGKLFQVSLLFACITGGATMLIVLFGADVMACNIMSLPRSAIALRVLAPTLLVVALMGVMRGYFQGTGTMLPTANSQLVEQIVNAIVSVGAAVFLLGGNDVLVYVDVVEGNVISCRAQASVLGVIYFIHIVGDAADPAPVAVPDLALGGELYAEVVAAHEVKALAVILDPVHVLDVVGGCTVETVEVAGLVAQIGKVGRYADAGNDVLAVKEGMIYGVALGVPGGFYIGFPDIVGIGGTVSVPEYIREYAIVPTQVGRIADGREGAEVDAGFYDVLFRCFLCRSRETSGGHD